MLKLNTIYNAESGSQPRHPFHIHSI